MNKKIITIALLMTLVSCVSCKNKTSSSHQNSENSQSLNSETQNSENSQPLNSETQNSENSSDNSSSSITLSQSNSSSSSSSIIEQIKYELNTPILSLDKETGIVTWNEIEGATHYNYVINDGEIKTTVNRTLNLKNQENISVQASNDQGFSEFSSALTYYDTSDIEIEEVKNAHIYFHNSNIPSMQIEVGKTISRPANPSKANYTFDDWYKDSFYQEKFDFSSPIEKNTIVYANWTPNDLVKDTFYWVKGSSHITSSVSSSNTGWKFMPLKLNEGQTSYKEFCVTVQVNGASETSPAQFIVMDGFSDDSGRTYWKKGTDDFTIKSDGTYNIYFSAEHQYAEGIHILVSPASNAGLSYLKRNQGNSILKTPLVEVDNDKNTCSWKKDANAVAYEVIVDNGEVKTITSNSYNLSKRSHITVRSVYEDGSKSNWSIPKANINYVIKEVPSSTEAYVYFKDSNLAAIKVNKNETVNEIVLNDEENRTFEGWYLDPSLKTKATFPYVVVENTVFYPKWNYQVNKEFYILTDTSGNKVGGFTWNLDNYDFFEYEMKYKVLDAKDYKIKSIDGQITYSSFSIGKKGTYSIYFSEENLWDHPDIVGQKRNIYIRHDKTDIYFTNSRRWSGDIYAYYWNNTTQDKKEDWPGVKLEKVKTNDMGEDIYKVSIDLVQYDYVIFNNGSGKQTIDISISGVSSNQAYYAKESTNGNGHYEIGKWTYQD